MCGKLYLFTKVVRCKFLNNAYYSTKGSNRLLDILANMPKSNTARIAEVQRQRQKNAKKGDKYGPSTIYLQVLGSGARGAPNTLYLFTDQKRYMFNCGECTQRLAHEHKVKLSKLDHIFITSKTWKNLGGLPGLSLTLQDVGVPNITLHGPEGLDELYNATKRFVIMKDLNVTMAKCKPSEDFEDNVMSVKYVILSPQQTLFPEMKPVAKKPKLDSSPDHTNKHEQDFEEFIHDDTDYYRRETDRSKTAKQKAKVSFDKDKEKKKPEKLHHVIPKVTNNCSVAYICTLKKRLGTLDLEKCVELGVKPGPLLGQLKCGQDVVLPDGTLVMSKDVKTPDDPGPVFIVLELPDIKWLKEDEFAAHFDNGTNPSENIPTVIVHYTPPHVFHHPKYQAFMSLFGTNTQHLILNGQNSCLGSEAVHKTQHKLHLLDPDIFPLLKDLSVPAVWNAHPPLPKTSSPIRLKGLEELKNKIAVAQFQTIINMEGSGQGEGEGEPTNENTRLNFMAARTLTMFHLRPKRELDRSAEPKLHIQDYIQETMDVDGFVPSLEQFRTLVDNLRYAKSDAREFPKVVFLGTGSCIPSKTRNTSGIVLQIDENRSMLLDCGEGTFNQLVRFYGPKRVNTFLRSLKAIFVSHLHADHHIGLMGVLQARRHALDEISSDDTLYLLAPGQIVTWLSKYDQQFETIRNEFTLIPNQNLLEAKLSDSPNTNITSAVLAGIGVENITSCLVSHCPNAFGVAVQVDEKHKVTYSGDTIPCEELVKIGMNSTLLIHEATMEDELADEARTKMHSTTSQAIEIGRKMNATFTVLTHFSQRYARLPRLNAHILNDNKSVGIAFDNMQITMSDLELLPHMYAPLQLMFAEHCVELELKAALRQKHKERLASTPNLPTSGASSRSRTNSQGASLQEDKLKYRESNSSRLRRENKFAPVTSDAVNASCRSRSCSSPRRSPISRLSNSTNGSGAQSAERSRSNNSNRSSASHKPIEKNTVEQKPRDVNSHSRNKNSPSNFSSKSAEPRKELKPARNGPRHTSDNTVAPSNADSPNGYGKPLVTPMNKRLLINRNGRPVSSPAPSKIPLPQFSRSRSPLLSWKAENRPSSTSSTPKRDLSKVSILFIDTIISISTHILLWRLYRIAACLSYLQWQFMITIIAVSYLFWTANKTCRDKRPNTRETRNPPLMAFNTAVKVRPRPPSPELKSGLGPAKSAPANKKPQHLTGTKSTKASRNKQKTQDDVKSNASSHKYLNNQNNEMFGHIKMPTIIKANSEGTNHNEISAHIKTPFVVKPSFVNYGSKSFKPQLEDIKSSHFVLNMKKQEHSVKRNCHSPNPTIQKPQPLIEEQRRIALLQAKNKFKTKKFWDDDMRK
ncbi:ribonuclease Z, mitochondrial isoform X3 [Pieris napi]|uniref:ribonuclease Z, mitochondrial isoform X3 n=1 Tax=Pieris napi TaxID=78633 RepID=UPI001FB958EC|nr:ribonuclease Z, mitochondrial isoform X3 [Pieris napi]